MRYPRHYEKNLTHLTTIRMSPSLRQESERCADFLGISFSDFVRQSLNRNIRVSSNIENEYIKTASARAAGR
jgi:hypothetical protein